LWRPVRPGLAVTSLIRDRGFAGSHVRPHGAVYWISVKGGAQHDVRIKVSRGPKATPSEMSSVAIRPAVEVREGHLDSSDLELLKRWVELNRETILKYWESEIDTQDAVNALRPIE
jgi:hypothetical protein